MLVATTTHKEQDDIDVTVFQSIACSVMLSVFGTRAEVSDGDNGFQHSDIPWQRPTPHPIEP